MNKSTKIVLTLITNENNYVVETFYNFDYFCSLRNIKTFQQFDKSVIEILMIHAFGFEFMENNNISSYLICQDVDNIRVDLRLQNIYKSKHFFRKLKIDKFLRENE